jgi:antitoxin MazE
VTTRLQKWGNSLAVRIPKGFAEELGIGEESQIEIKLIDSSIVIRPKLRTIPSLKELVAGITEENRHPEYDWGPPVGKEIW